MNCRRQFIASGLLFFGVGRTTRAQLATSPVRYAPLSRPVRIPLDAVATPWRPVPFVAEAFTPPARGAAQRRVLIHGVLFRTDTGLSALCITCPHEQCQVDLVTDGARLAKMPGGTATQLHPVAPVAPGRTLSRPLFECGCHFSVFDAANDGARVSGESPRGLYRFGISAARDAFVDITEVEEVALFEV